MSDLYMFNASMQIGEAMSLTVTGNISKNADQKAIEGELDKIFAAMEKQNVKRMKIPTVKGALQDQKDQLARNLKQLDQLKFKAQAKPLGTAERTQFETLESQSKQLAQHIEKGEEVLAALEKEAA